MAKPEKCISVTEARQLHDNWVNTRAGEIQRLQGFNDTRDFTFSLSDLEEYVQYVKEESVKQGVSNPGIRIYFAAYDSIKSDRATVFLAPTLGVEEDADNNYEIDPLNTITGGWPPNNY